MEELISIIINVHNGEKYIKKCLNSVVNQTYKNLEILIINDGSTDNTSKICESFTDKRIRIITTENLGLSMSRNVGLDNAKGEYLYFIDCDDFIELDVIQYLYDLIKKNNVLISSCKSLEIYSYDFTVKNKKEKIKVLTNKEILKKLLLSIDNVGTTWNKLIKREVFNNIRFENRIVNDVVVTYKTLLAVDKIVYSNQIKYYYYRNNDSITLKKRLDRYIDMYKAILERYEYIKNKYPKLTENKVCVDYMIMYLYINNDEKVRNFLKEQNAIETYKKMFTWKVLITKMKFGNKMKIILFRINPNLCKTIYETYINIKNRIKK